jgi:hypothetical protein
MRKSTTIQKDIAENEEVLKMDGLLDDERKFAEDELKDLKKELEKALESEGGKKTAPKKTTAKKKTTKKKASPKKAVAKKPKEKRYVEVKGKKVYEDDDNFCDALIEQWRKRKEKAKKLGGARKTKPVTQRVASNIASAVTKGIKTIGKDEIKKNPKKAISRMERLEEAGKEFLEAYKDILGDTITQKEIKEEFEGLDKIIAKIKERYGKKTTKK